MDEQKPNNPTEAASTPPRVVSVPKAKRRFGDIQPGSLRGARPEFMPQAPPPDPDKELLEKVKKMSASELRMWMKEDPQNRKRLEEAQRKRQ